MDSKLEKRDWSPLNKQRDAHKSKKSPLIATIYEQGTRREGSGLAIHPIGMVYGKSKLIVPIIAVIAIGAYEAYHLTRFPVAVGLDGYYYALQLTHLRTTGSLYFQSATPLIFCFLYGLDVIVNNSFLTIKIVAITLHVLLCAGLFLNIFALTRSIWLSTVSCLLATTSGLHFFFVAEFLKNLLGIVFLVWAGFGFQQALGKHRRLWTAFSLILLILAFLSHKSTIGIAFLLATVFILLRFLLSTTIGTRYYPVSLLLLFSIWVSPLILRVQPFIKLPGSLLAELTGGKRWKFPPLLETLVLLVLTIVTIYLVPLLRERLPDRAVMFLSLIAVWSALISVNPLLNPMRDLDSVFGRLKALTYIQIALLVPGLIWVVQVSYRKWLPYSAIALPLVMVCIYSGPPPSMSDAFLARRTSIVKNLPAFREHLCATPVIIATHGDQFLVTAVLGVSSQKEWPPESKYQCTYWLLNMVREDIVPPSQFILADESTSSYSDQIHMPENTRLYSIIVKNEDLTSEIANLSVEQRRWLLTYNPHLSRYLEETTH
jgi:hypothetical protein